MNDKKELIEVQGTGEEATFTRTQLNAMLDFAEKGINELIEIQNKIIQEA
jgi:ribonuclease PH